MDIAVRRYAARKDAGASMAVQSEGVGVVPLDQAGSLGESR
jgi:hypothetical protein